MSNNSVNNSLQPGLPGERSPELEAEALSAQACSSNHLTCRPRTRDETTQYKYNVSFFIITTTATKPHLILIRAVRIPLFE